MFVFGAGSTGSSSTSTASSRRRRPPQSSGNPLFGGSGSNPLSHTSESQPSGSLFTFGGTLGSNVFSAPPGSNGAVATSSVFSGGNSAGGASTSGSSGGGIFGGSFGTGTFGHSSNSSSCFSTGSLFGGSTSMGINAFGQSQNGTPSGTSAIGSSSLSSRQQSELGFGQPGASGSSSSFGSCFGASVGTFSFGQPQSSNVGNSSSSIFSGSVAAAATGFGQPGASSSSSSFGSCFGPSVGTFSFGQPRSSNAGNSSSSIFSGTGPATGFGQPVATCSTSSVGSCFGAGGGTFSFGQPQNAGNSSSSIFSGSGAGAATGSGNPVVSSSSSSFGSCSGASVGTFSFGQPQSSNAGNSSSSIFTGSGAGAAAGFGQPVASSSSSSFGSCSGASVGTFSFGQPQSSNAGNSSSSIFIGSGTASGFGSSNSSLFGGSANKVALGHQAAPNEGSGLGNLFAASVVTSACQVQASNSASTSANLFVGNTASTSACQPAKADGVLDLWRHANGISRFLGESGAANGESGGKTSHASRIGEIPRPLLSSARPAPWKRLPMSLSRRQPPTIRPSNEACAFTRTPARKKRPASSVTFSSSCEPSSMLRTSSQCASARLDRPDVADFDAPEAQERPKKQRRQMEVATPHENESTHALNAEAEDPRMQVIKPTFLRHGALELKLEDASGRAHVSKLVPTLSRAGYFSRPSIEQMAEMSEDQLTEIDNLSVCREGYGSIQWPGITDVRGLDLDRLVRITDSAVTVYPEEGSMPPAGTKLNKEAVITLNVKRSASSQEQVGRLQKRLQQLTEAAGHTFISYDLDTWVFSVPNFDVRPAA